VVPTKDGGWEGRSILDVLARGSRSHGDLNKKKTTQIKNAHSRRENDNRKNTKRTREKLKTWNCTGRANRAYRDEGEERKITPPLPSVGNLYHV